MPHFIQDSFDKTYTHSSLSSDASPMKLFKQEGHPNIWIIAGDNATGKSFLMKNWASTAYHDFNTEPMEMSMRSRTKEGMQRALVWGAEAQQSTGELSVKTTLKALRNIPSRLESGHHAFVILDEPDLGLSDGYKYAFGQLLGDQALNMPEEGKAQWGILLITHSRQLVQGLVDALGMNPTFVHTQHEKTLQDWLKQTPQYSAQDLLNLNEKSRAFSKGITALENQTKQLKQQQKKEALYQRMNYYMENLGEFTYNTQKEIQQEMHNLASILDTEKDSIHKSYVQLLIAQANKLKTTRQLNQYLNDFNQSPYENQGFMHDFPPPQWVKTDGEGRVTEYMWNNNVEKVVYPSDKPDMQVAKKKRQGPEKV